VFLFHLQGTLYLNIFYILLGVKVSLFAHLETTDITGFDVIEIERGCIVSQGAAIHGHSHEGT
jgi:hypothetical protein